jgi:hypothetical protein
MAKRKNLKKTINGICGVLFTDVLICAYNHPELPTQTIDELLAQILNLQNEFIARINHTEKGSVKKFYIKLRNEFETAINQLIDKINELN